MSARGTCRLIAIEGIDGAGKTTHTSLLVESLRTLSLRVENLHFPDTTTHSGILLSKALRGEAPIPTQSRFALFAANRLESKPKIDQLLDRCDAIVFDRYYQSELAYGLAFDLPFEWLHSLDAKMPRADLVVLLDLDPRVAIARVSSRPISDIHETNIGLLSRVRSNYRRLAQWPPDPGQQWIVLDTSAATNEVHSTLVDQVHGFLQGSDIRGRSDTQTPPP